MASSENSTESSYTASGLFRFNHNEKMVKTKQDVIKHQDGNVHAYQSLERGKRDRLKPEDGDELLVLTMANGKSVLYRQNVRIDEGGTTPKWSLQSKEKELLNLQPGDVTHSWVTIPVNFSEYTEIQQRLATADDHGVGAGDPTSLVAQNGSWLFLRDRTLPEGKASDGVSGKVKIHKEPYREYLNIDDGDILIMNVVKGDTEIPFHANIVDNGKGFTIPQTVRCALELEPGDEVSLWVHTQSVVKNIDQSMASDIINSDYINSDAAHGQMRMSHNTTEDHLDAHAEETSAEQTAHEGHTPHVLVGERTDEEWSAHLIGPDGELACGTQYQDAIPDHDGDYRDRWCIECLCHAPETEINQDALTEFFKNKFDIDIAADPPYELDITEMQTLLQSL